MVVEFDIHKFVDSNDKEIRIIASSLARGADSDLLNDLVQNFYMVIIKNDTLSKFDKTVPNIPRFFAKYIYQSVKFSIHAYMSDRRLAGDSRWETSVANKAESTIDIFESLNVDGSSLKMGEGTPRNVEYTTSVGMENASYDEDRFMTMLAAFEAEIGGCEDLSARTRHMYGRYLTFTKAGVKPIDFAAEHEITPSYATSIRLTLRKRFREFRKRYEELELC